jgi:Tol biopolymer transport system component
MSPTTTRLLAAATLAASVMAASGAASAAAEEGGPAERVAAVTVGNGRATVYSGDAAALPSTRTLRSGDRAALSPDARLVAYTRVAAGRAEIHVASVSGTTDRLLARVRPYDIALAFAPDGRTLAYSSAAGIATIGLSGAGSRSLATPRAWRGSRYSSLAYTPDGRRLLASRTTGDGRAGTLRNELVALNVASGRGTTLYRSPNPYDQQARPASFSPDGSTVAMDGTGGILLVPTASGAERQLTAPPRNGYDFAPLISPDGTRVAFARTRDRGVADVYVIGIDGIGLRRVTTTPIPPQGTPKVGSTPLAWSPDGHALLTFRHDRFAAVDVQTGASTDVRTVGVRYSVPAARWVGG